MAKPDYTGPWGMSKQQHRDFYLRWRQVMAAASARQYHMMAHPKHAGYFKDLVEELLEDPHWVQPPPLELMFVTSCPEGELVFWRTDTGAVSLQEMIGRTGLGRFSRAAAPSREGVQPMSTMKVPKDVETTLHPSTDPTPLRSADTEKQTEKLTDELERQDREVYGDE